MKMNQTVRINKPSDPYHGQAGSITFIYYDHLHTGSSPDLLLVRMADGQKIRTTSEYVEEVSDEAAA